MIRIDLHVHSTFSDGACTVEELVRLAARRNVVLLSLTDHDSVEGLPGFFAACAKYSVRPLAGIELSAKSAGTIHILGYRMTKMTPLIKALEPIIVYRNERNLEICAKLRSLGLEITIEDIRREAGGQVIARPHFACALIRKGYARDMASAFTQFLGEGAPAYVEREGYSPAECIQILKEAGGLSVLAHPSLTGLEGEAFDALLRELKEAGLWGLECISPHSPGEKTFELLTVAGKHGLFPTAGSDFHGGLRPDADLGVQVSESFLPWARLGITL